MLLAFFKMQMGATKDVHRNPWSAKYTLRRWGLTRSPVETDLWQVATNKQKYDRSVEAIGSVLTASFHQLQSDYL